MTDQPIDGPATGAARTRPGFDPMGVRAARIGLGLSRTQFAAEVRQAGRVLDLAGIDVVADEAAVMDRQARALSGPCVLVIRPS